MWLKFFWPVYMQLRLADHIFATRVFCADIALNIAYVVYYVPSKVTNNCMSRRC